MMYRTRTLYLLIVTLFSTKGKLVQGDARCEPYSSARVLEVSTQREYCAGAISEGQLIYVNSGESLASLNDAVGRLHWLFALLPVQNDCHRAFASFTCRNAFQSCSSLLTPSPQTLCPSICDDAFLRCRSYFDEYPEFKPNCSSNSALSCLSSVEMLDVPIVCPAPLVNPKTIDEWGRSVLPLQMNNRRFGGGSCSLRCISNVPLATHFDRLDLIATVLASVSCVATIYLIATFAFYPEQKVSNRVVYFCWCSFMAQLMILINLALGRERVVCANNVEPTTSPTSWCAIQAGILHYFVLAAVGWWFCQVIELFLKVALNRGFGQVSERKRAIAYHIGCWILPLIAVIVTASLQSYGSDDGILQYCLVVGTAQWWVLYNPVLLIAIGGAVMMIAVCLTLFSRRPEGGILLYARPLLYLLFFLYVWISIVTFRFYTATIRPKVVEAVTQWTRCMAIEQPFRKFYQGSSDFSCGQPSTNIDYHNLYEVTISVSLLGVAMFLVYGTKVEYILWWHSLICKCFKPKFRPSPEKIELSMSYSETNFK